MANIKITQLTEIVAPANEDVLPIVDVSGDITQKVQAANLPISTATQTALDAKQATLVSGTNIKTINSTSLLGSGNISIAANPAGTAGQIQFSDGSAFAADSNLFWDNTNKRLGVGTSSPSGTLETVGNTTINGVLFSSTSINSYKPFYMFASTGFVCQNSAIVGATSTPTARLQVKGAGSTSATTSLLVQNSSGNNLLQILDDGQIAFGYIKPISTIMYLTGSSALRSDGRISVGTTSIDASAQLQADSTTKGFLPPRMTTTQKNAISTPALGLQVVDTTTSRPCVYTSAWESLTSSDSASPTAVYKFWSGTAAQYAALTPDSNTVYFVS